MNGDLDNPAENPNDQTNAGDNNAPQYVNLDEITDVEQLRDIQANPDKYTTTPPPAAGEGEGESEGENATPPAAGEGDPDGGDDDDAGDEPPAEPAKPAATRIKVRASHLDDAQRKVLSLVSSKRIPIPEAQAQVVADLVQSGQTKEAAEAAVYGNSPRPAAPKAEPAKTEKTDETPDPVAQQQKVIDDLREKLAVARAGYKVDEIESLRDQIDDAKDTLRDLKAEAKAKAAQQEQSKETAFATAVNNSVAESIDLFPDAANEGTELFEAIQDAVEDRKESEPDFFKNPRWPIILAAEQAALLGIPSTKHKAGATPAKGEQPVQPKKTARTITPASGSSGGSPKTTGPTDPQTEYAAAEAALAAGDPAPMQAFLRQRGTRELGAQAA